MELKEIRKKVKSLGKFYYYFDFDGVKTRSKDTPHRGIKNWRRHLSEVLPPIISNFSTPTIADIGSNMGLLPYEMSKIGGVKVIGMEKEREYFEQSKFLEKFIRDHRKQKWNVELNCLDILKDEIYSEQVNIVTFFSVIYWLEPNEDEVIERVKKFFPNHEYLVLQGNYTSAVKNLTPECEYRKLARLDGMVNFMKKHGYSIHGIHEWKKYPKPVVVGKR